MRRMRDLTGRGVARVLAACGARVFDTGRSVGGEDGGMTGIRCDHRVDSEVPAAFGQIEAVAGGIDILVNNVWSGYENMINQAGPRLERVVKVTGDPVSILEARCGA
ncbi:MAG: hypothetical protein JNM66_09225 [Bryobacterales bacterium]|nr:hypothetical protein [Bryobacterales bacterium]